MKLIITIEDEGWNREETLDCLGRIGEEVKEAWEGTDYVIDSSVTFATQGDLDRHIASKVEAKRHEYYNAGQSAAINAVGTTLGELRDTIREEPEEVGIPNVQIAKFAVGDTVRVTRQGIIVPFGVEFEVEEVHAASEGSGKPYGAYYYTGKGAKSGVWENFLVAVTPNVQIAKFAIGDMVRLVKGFGSVFEIGTVKFQQESATYIYQFVGALGWYGEGELEVAPKFAVGDKVRLTMSNALGEVAEVLDSASALPGYRYRVRLANGDTFYYAERSLNVAVDA